MRASKFTFVAVSLHAIPCTFSKANYWTGKHLLALKCLLALHALDPHNPALHVQSYRLRDSLDHLPDGLSPKWSEIVLPGTKMLFHDDKDLSAWNNDFLKRHKSSASHVQAGLRVRALIGKEAKEVNEKDLCETLLLEDTTMQNASAGLELLHEWGSSEEVRGRYKSSAAERWKMASVFRSSTYDKR